MHTEYCTYNFGVRVILGERGKRSESEAKSARTWLNAARNPPFYKQSDTLCRPRAASKSRVFIITEVMTECFSALRYLPNILPRICSH